MELRRTHADLEADLSSKLADVSFYIWKCSFFYALGINFWCSAAWFARPLVYIYPYEFCSIFFNFHQEPVVILYYKLLFVLIGIDIHGFISLSLSLCLSFMSVRTQVHTFAHVCACKHPRQISNVDMKPWTQICVHFWACILCMFICIVF